MSRKLRHLTLVLSISALFLGAGTLPAHAAGPTVCEATGAVDISPTSKLLTGGIEGGFSTATATSLLPNQAVCAGVGPLGSTGLPASVGEVAASGDFDIFLGPVVAVNNLTWSVTDLNNAVVCNGLGNGFAYGAVAVLSISSDQCGNPGVAVATFTVTENSIDPFCSIEEMDVCLEEAFFVGVFALGL